jgi:hypothetical protein
VLGSWASTTPLSAKFRLDVALDRNELGAPLVAAGLGPPREHALISLLALNGLRVSEATGADVEPRGGKSAGRRRGLQPTRDLSPAASV